MKSARNNMLAKIHLAKRDLGLSDADYRHVLSVLFGADEARLSAAKLDDRELHQLLDHFRSKGWAPAGGRTRKESLKDRKPEVPEDRAGLMGKIEALLAEKRRLEAKPGSGAWLPWKYAEAILRRQTNNPHAYLNWATPAQLTKVIQALSYNVRRAAMKAEAV